MKIEIYTDGSCSGNGQKDAYGGGGWQLIMDGRPVRWECFGRKGTTNQRMELEAAAKACEWVKENYFLYDEVIIYSDSAYLINCVNQNWWRAWRKNGWRNSKKQPVANRDLWEDLIPFFEDDRYTFVKVKGHSGVNGNETVDKLAVNGTSIVSSLGTDYFTSGGNYEDYNS